MTASPAGAPSTGPAFSSLPLADHVLANLQRLGYEHMTPIQAASLPLALAGKDLIAQAKTGSGKTAAFTLPLLANLRTPRAGLTPSPPPAGVKELGSGPSFLEDLSAYLLATWHPSTRPAAIEPNEPGLKWLGLEVRRHTVQDAAHATVEFVARSKLGGRALRQHETSRFVREPAGPHENEAEARWFYLDGETRHPASL